MDTDAECTGLHERLLKLLSSPDYVPALEEQVIKKIRLGPKQEEIAVQVLKQAEADGEIVRIRGDRLVLPEKAQLQIGRIHFHERGFAWVVGNERGQSDLFVPAENTGTAFHGDRVVARVQPRPGSSTRRLRGKDDGREGRVIRILQRARETMTGTLDRSHRFFVVVADDPRFVQPIYVPAAKGATKGDKVLVRLDEWRSRHVHPEGEIIEVLGRGDDPSIWGIAILRKFGLEPDFPDAVLREVKAAKAPSDRDLANREDCRDQMAITIDPDDARDFDDAIFVEPTSKGWRAAVHIADVAHYVKVGSALDQEALRRGNSVYLVDRVVPMLPERLSNDLCSLRPKEDRFAFSVFLDFDSEGNPKQARFARTLIRSAARLTYGEALSMLTQPTNGEVAKRVRAAWELCRRLRQRRFAKGALDLDFPEIKVRLDASGQPSKIERLENDISHQLIEELMLVANEAAARSLRHGQVPTLYRIHEKPDPDKLLEFREVLAQYGIEVGNLSSPGEVRRMLALLKSRPEEHALKVAFLRSLKRACYDVSPVGHYGLAKADYLHFTSPIRRYADLVVHRSLESLLLQHRVALASQPLKVIAEHLSETERNAADAERDHKLLMQMAYFEKQIDTGNRFRAMVMDVRPQGVLVELPDFVVSGMVRTSMLGEDFFRFDGSLSRFVGSQKGEEIGLGSQLEVEVASVDFFRKHLDFRVASVLKPTQRIRQPGAREARQENFKHHQKRKKR